MQIQTGTVGVGVSEVRAGDDAQKAEKSSSSSCQRGDVLVVKGARRGRRCVLALLLLGGDDGFQVLTLPPLLAPIPVRGLRNLLRLVDGGLFDVGAIHHDFPATRAGLRMRGARLRIQQRSGARDASGCAHGIAMQIMDSKV